MDRTVGPYRLGETIGVLPFGELVAATHPARSEPLAVLLLDERLAKDIRLRGLLRLEIARTGSLRHPSLARTIEIGEAAGALYLVVERPAEATTLACRVEGGQEFSPSEIASLVTALAAGLDAAHGRRVAHGAIDPTSILLGANGATMLVGVGIMAAVQDAGLLDVVLGRRSGGYTAPEQQGGPGTQAVASADGYALAALAARFLEPLTLERNASVALRLALGRERSPNPSDRFPTCTEFAKALSDALAASSDAVVAPGPSARPTAPVPPTPPSIPASQPSSRSPVPSPPTAPNTPSPAIAGTAEIPSSNPTPAPWAIPPKPATSPDATTPQADDDVAARPLPWDASSPATPAPPTARPTARTPRPEGRSTPNLTPAPHVEASVGPRASSPASPPADFGSWVREIIDPPRPANSPSTAQTPSPPSPPTPPWDSPPPIPESSAEALSVATFDATPAMLDLLRRLERSDPLGDAVRWAARLSPAAEGLLEQYVPNGKIGPVPLGLAVAGVLALLFLVVGLPVLTAAIAALAFVLYVVPRVTNFMTRGEKPAQQAIRVTGLALLKRRQVGAGWTAIDLELGNGARLNVSPADVPRLEAIGRAVSVQRPSPVSGGAETATLEHQLSNVTVTYLAMSMLLLDVRNAAGEVVLQHPKYHGEAGDRRAPTPATPVMQPSTTWSRCSRGQSIALPMSSALASALEREREAATKRLAVIGLAPLGLIVVASALTNFGGLAVVVAIGIYLLVGISALDRVHKLKSAAQAGSFLRVVGPVTVTQHAKGNSQHYRMLLENGAILTIDKETHGAISRTGELRLGEERGPYWQGGTQRERLISSHEAPSLTVSYEPTGPLLLEITNPFGQVIYREPVLGKIDLGSAPPLP